MSFFLLKSHVFRTYSHLLLYLWWYRCNTFVFVFNTFPFLLMVAKVRSLGYSSFISHYFLSNFSIQASFTAGVPNLQDLIPDDLSWSWHNNNRNKVHNKCNMLELSQNHSPCDLVREKNFQWNWSLVPKRLRTTALQHKEFPPWITDAQILKMFPFCLIDLGICW